MFHINDISRMPTCSEGNKIHESVLRAWNILRVVKQLLEAGTPQTVVLALIEDMEHKSESTP